MPEIPSELYDHIGERYRIRGRILEALVMVESSGWSNRRPRLEPHRHDMSIGPAQVLTGTAAWLVNCGHVHTPEVAEGLRKAFELVGTQGISPVWTAMERPEVSIELAAAYLRWQLNRYDDNLLDAIAAYNAGTAVRRMDGQYSNQAYVDKWLIAYDEVGADSDPEGTPDSHSRIPSAW